MAEFKGTEADLTAFATGEANQYYLVNDNTGKWLYSIQHNGEQLVEEQKANINLIAASYDLLEALQEMIRMYETIQPAGGWQGVYESAVSAVKKATK